MTKDPIKKATNGTLLFPGKSGLQPSHRKTDPEV